MDNEQMLRYKQDLDRKIHQLECENAYLAKKIQSKVLNKRTGITRQRTILTDSERIKREQIKCVTKFWTRTPRSNSVNFEFRTVQNMND